MNEIRDYKEVPWENKRVRPFELSQSLQVSS